MALKTPVTKVVKVDINILLCAMICIQSACSFTHCRLPMGSGDSIQAGVKVWCKLILLLLVCLKDCEKSNARHVLRLQQHVRDF